MFRVVQFCAVVCLLIAAHAAPAAADSLSATDRSRYAAAIAAADAREWDAARDMAAGADNPLIRKLVQWMRLTTPGSDASFSEFAEFISQNPAWPRLSLLRRYAEEAIDDWTPRTDLRRWFDRFPPLTGAGAMRYAEALLNAGESDRARVLAREAWVERNFSEPDERRFRKTLGQFLAPQDHVARLDRLLWDSRVTEAQRMFRSVDTGHERLALARIALMRDVPGVDGAVARVPSALRSHPGLVYERLRWRRRAGLYEGALELLETAGDDLGQPDKWWLEQRILVRRLLEEGNPERAYRVVRQHGQVDGLAHAEAEWLAGWIALRYLDRGQVAFGHFRDLFENVQYPVSKARGAYWAGRAATAAGEGTIGQQWYATAAQYFTTFYGQLAATNLEPSLRPARPADPDATSEDVATFNAQELVQLVRILTQIGKPDAIDPFVVRLTDEPLTSGQWVLLARLSEEAGRDELAIHVSKEALKQDIVLVERGYPMLGSNAKPDGLDTTLVHAVIRQESAFKPDAISSAGARGLMQLMPATARRVADDLRRPYSHAQLTQDPGYNVALGQRYLSQMIDRFNGSLIPAIAAYNAGPHRVSQWLRENGRVGQTREDTIDWIENIPFYETRNYVQRVLEHMTVYALRMGRGDGTLALPIVVNDKQRIAATDGVPLRVTQ